MRLEGDTPELGDFEIQIVDGPLNTHPKEGFNQDLIRTQWWGREVPEGQVWRSKGIGKKYTTEYLGQILTIIGDRYCIGKYCS